MASKRGSTAATQVLKAPRESFAPEAGWRGRGPAPAGSLHRPAAFANDGEDARPGEKPYVPRRGSVRGRFDVLRRSLAGRILLGLSLLLLLGGAAVGAAAVRYFALHDPRFVLSTSDDIAVSGNTHLTREQVLMVFAPDLERSIFRMPLVERRADLERLPWVQHATVMRLLPDHLQVEIRERTPVAFVRQGTQIGLVDANGVLLDMPAEDAGDPRYSFPVLTGISAGDPLATRIVRIEIYSQFIKALDSTGEKLSNSVSEVDVANPEDVKALVTNGGTETLVHFGDTDFLSRYKEFEEHLPAWKLQYPKLASADMRYDGQIVLEMQKTPESQDRSPGTAEPGAIADAPVAAAGANLVAATAKVPKGRPLPASAAVGKKVPAQPVTKKVANKPVAKPASKPVLKPAHATAKPDANAKMYAALAAAHKASLAKSGAAE